MQLVTIAAVDPTLGLSERAKYFVTAIGTMDLTTRNIYLRHVERGRYEGPEQVEVVTRLYLEYRPLFVGIEETFYVWLIQELNRRGVVPVKTIDRRKQHNPKVGVRAMPLAFRYSQGKIFHPARVDKHGRDTGVSRWLDPFEEELLAFTGQDGRDEYTDQVSAWADVVRECLDLAASMARYDDYVQPIHHSFSYDAVQAEG